MRVMIGTLHTVENEFEECCKSIAEQTYKDFEHVIIRGLPGREAHHQLFSEFAKRKQEFDLLIKVDADIVLRTKTFFEDVVTFFRENPSILNYQVAVHDFFTDRLIGGMNSYRNSIPWSFDSKSLFVESETLNRLPPETRVFDNFQLAPAAWHCKNPSELQSLHFGIHKGLKVWDAIVNNWQRRAIEHCTNASMTWSVWKKLGDRRRLLAAYGAELALSKKLTLVCSRMPVTHFAN